MTSSLSSNPLGYNGIDFYQNPPLIRANRAPTTNDVYNIGTQWADGSVNPPVIYVTVGSGIWETGGNAAATTTSLGTVFLATLSELQNGNAPAGAYVPLSNDVATVIAGVVAGAVPPATSAQQGIVELATSAEVVSPYTVTIPNTALIPANITPMFAEPPAIGSTTPAAGAFTTLAASSTLSVTGASTIAALSATSGSFSTTLAVTGTTTLAAVNATNGTFSGTLGVTGTSTIAALSATNGTFSGTLGVTGTATLGVVASGNTTITGTLGVSGASTFSSATFSTTVGVTGLTTLAALTQVGTANINASGAAATNIATGGTGALNIGNATGNTAITGALTISTTLGVTGLTTLAALTQVGTTLINASGAAATTIGTGGTGAVNIGNATGNTAVTGSLTTSTTLTATLGNITATAGDIVATLGDVIINGAAKQLRVHGGAVTDFIGTGVLTAGTQTIANTNIAATDRILLVRISPAASVTLGELTYTISAGASFTVTSVILGTPASTQTADVSTYAYFIVRQV